MIDTILLVPAVGDPHGLLADGVCGARVPTLPLPMPSWRVVERRALVLAYQGKPVPEGCDRANRAVIAATNGDFGGTLDYYDDGYPLRRGPFLVSQLGGRLVLLDADGHEVTP